MMFDELGPTIMWLGVDGLYEYDGNTFRLTVPMNALVKDNVDDVEDINHRVTYVRKLEPQ